MEDKEECIFLSHFLNEFTPSYGGKKKLFKIEKKRKIKLGDHVNTSFLSFPNHIGTHIDFPYHFVESGKTLNDYPAGFWTFNKVGFINSTFDNLKKNIIPIDKEIEFLIVKTGFGSKRSTTDYWKKQPIIKAATATLLKKKFKNLKVLGFDMISLTSQLNKAEGRNAHLNFLKENDILIIEDMKLDNLGKCPSRVIISPLQIDHIDGSPCTIFSFS
jgi:arylformamidase